MWFLLISINTFIAIKNKQNTAYTKQKTSMNQPKFLSYPLVCDSWVYSSQLVLQEKKLKHREIVIWPRSHSLLVGKGRTQVSWFPIHYFFLWENCPTDLNKKKKVMVLPGRFLLFLNLNCLFLEHCVEIWLLPFCKVIGIRDSALKSGRNPGLGMVIFLWIIRNCRA